jgi:Fe2+ transport system protein B
MLTITIWEAGSHTSLLACRRLQSTNRQHKDTRSQSSSSESLRNMSVASTSTHSLTHMRSAFMLLFICVGCSSATLNFACRLAKQLKQCITRYTTSPVDIHDIRSEAASDEPWETLLQQEVCCAVWKSILFVHRFLPCISLYANAMLLTCSSPFAGACACSGGSSAYVIARCIETVKSHS